MPILQGDIKLAASQVMSDAPQGGGAPTAVQIVDGQSNGVFPDISEADRAGGRVNLRKVFVQVLTNSTDTYLGANVILEDPPDDPLVGVTLFSTGQTFDRRTDATNRIESYLTIGPVLSAYLFGDHIGGMMTLTLLAQPSAVLPVAGASLVLRRFPGQPTQKDQYVRVTNVASRLRTFTDTKGDFQRLEITLSISDPLDSDYPGFDAIREDSALNFSARTRVHDTVVADAARYFGVAPLMAPAAIGDFSVQAQSIFSQLVPSAQAETPIADARMNQQLAMPVEAGAPLTIAIPAMAFTTTQPTYIGGCITPGSLTFARAGITLKDKGGTLINAATSAQVGLVDYANGILTLNTNVFGTGTGSASVTYTPAATPQVVSQSIGLPVTQSSQRLAWVMTLLPIPIKGTAQLSYRSGGRWYVLQDDGAGAMRGADSSFGVASVNFTTGTLTATLGALPDVGSKIIVSWGPSAVAPKASAVQLAPSTLQNKAYFAVDLGKAIKPGSVSLTWNDGQARSATDNNGGLVGYAVGEVLYADGVIRIAPSTLPPPGTVLNISITETTAAAQSFNFGDSGAQWTFNVGAGYKAGTLEFGVLAQRPVRVYPGIDQIKKVFLRVFDDGAGALMVAVPSGYLQVGAINYASGACALNKSVSNYQEAQDKWGDMAPVQAANQTYVTYLGAEVRVVPLTFLAAGGAAETSPPWAWWTGFAASAQARWSAADGAAQVATLAMTDLATRGLRQSFYLGSTRHVVSGTTIQANPSPVTGIGTVVGEYLPGPPPQYGGGGGYSIDVSAPKGAAILTAWPQVAPDILNSAGIVQPAMDAPSLLVDSVTFRTAVAPLRSGSFSVVGKWADGTQFNATADANGVISTGSAPGTPTGFGSLGVFGKVDYQTGVVELRFGKRAGADVVLGGMVTDWGSMGLPGITKGQSEGAQGDTLRYNASAFTYIPLDASIIGINPVRLPSDGRVPVFRAGSYAVVGHTAVVGPVTVANAQVVNCGRVRLSRVRVIGNDGVVINSGYTADLDAGLVTFTNVTGYAQPVRIEHRIEDMALVSDAQISGLITFTRPLTHAYPAGSMISSALVAGDLFARVAELFDQSSWTGQWADTQIGGAASGTFNAIANPITVTNAGAVTERWYVQFTSSTSFQVGGEHVGIIATGNTGTACSPINGATGQPYFTIPAAGWGIGWSTGNVLRFNTIGAEFPVWIARTVLQGPETIGSDKFTILARGDVDRP